MSHDCYKTAFCAAPDAILVLRPSEDGEGDFDAEIVVANPGAGALIGREAEALAGLRLSEALPAASERAVRRGVAHALARERSESVEVRWQSGGRATFVRATACLACDGLVLFLSDIGELQRARQEMDWQRREFAATSKVMATHAAHLADAAAAAEAARAALLEEIERREELERELQRMARTDALTGVLNRHGFTAEAKRLVGAAQRSGAPLAVVIVDADHFKAVNDTHGHAAGDAALAHLARFLASETRAGIDAVGRVGGEEFVLLLPRMDIAHAASLAERLRAGLAATAIAELRGFRLTASFGVAALTRAHAGFPEVLREADEALYRAKRAGRNRVEIAARDDAAAA